jgi:hypothetical protein
VSDGWFLGGIRRWSREKSTPLHFLVTEGRDEHMYFIPNALARVRRILPYRHLHSQSAQCDHGKIQIGESRIGRLSALSM